MQESQAIETPTDQAQRSPANRRLFDRVLCHVDVTLESESTFYQGFTENISAGGLFIATYDVRELGQRIGLQFTLPGREQPINVECEVRWVREYNDSTPDTIPGMGVRFLDIHPQDVLAIEAFVRQREPLFYDDDL